MKSIDTTKIGINAFLKKIIKIEIKQRGKGLK